MNPLEHDEEFQLSLRNPNPSFRALKSGDVYRVDFELSKEEWEYFTDPNIDRTGMVIENICRVTHRAMKSISGSSNGRIEDFDSSDAGSSPAPETNHTTSKPSVGEISQVPATTLAGTDQSEPVKGGKWSIQAGIMCSNPKFQEFLKLTYWVLWETSTLGKDSEMEIAAIMIRALCKINSRKKIDTNLDARKRFMDLMGKFNRWTEGKDGPN